ncbi:hypothetical protein K3X41_10825 [Aliiroseovarius crassostreae]|uniref:hypothetical protein n=1 Tax=Aliiroseovarius crassostreae TaxID=154981 RepID=UPI002202E533|nr:hypothetical protein [Aliiroseovarius crassostreae]UWQ07290.1 hypothetical protein K3X25_10945 [Aliiroseovarius crassostreae]UWQ10400.1 hypothetical protein K3X41_10825 [Aliiroseovarius crassostreae]
MELISALLGFGFMAGFFFSDSEGDNEDELSSSSFEEDETTNGPLPEVEPDTTVETTLDNPNLRLVPLEQSLLANGQNEIALPEDNMHILYVNTPLNPEVEGVWNIHNFNELEGEIVLEANSLNTHLKTGASYIPDVRIVENADEQYTDLVLKSLDSHGDEWIQTIRLHGSVGVTEDSILVAEQGEIGAEYDGDFSELKEFKSISNELTSVVERTHVSGTAQGDVQENIRLIDSHFFAKGGDDEILAFAENSSIFGGEGDDTIDVYAASSDRADVNAIFGGDGDDKITTNVGAQVDGGEGFDEINVVVGAEDLQDGIVPTNIYFDYQEDTLELIFPSDFGGSLNLVFDGPHFSGNESTFRFDVSVYYSDQASEALTQVITLAPHYIENPLADGQNDVSLESAIDRYKSEISAAIQTNLQQITVVSKDLL